MRCPTCGSVSPKDKDLRFWWACWECLLCAKYVCNQPVLHADKWNTTTCYVKHLAEHHGHVYEVKR